MAGGAVVSLSIVEQDEWTVTYFKNGFPFTANWLTLEHAVGFACDGDEDWEFAAHRIDGPNGEVLEGQSLTLAKLRLALPERYGCLADMPLA